MEKREAIRNKHQRVPLRRGALRSGCRPDDLDLVFRTRTGYPYNHSLVDLLVREARKRAGLGPIQTDRGGLERGGGGPPGWGTRSRP